MLTELQQRRLWENWLSAEIAAFYFADLAGVYRRRQQFSLWGTLLASSGAATAAVAHLPAGWSWLAPVFALAAAGISGYMLVIENHRRESDCRDLFVRWNRLALAYERLWGKMHGDDADEQLAMLERRTAEISKDSTAFPAHRRRLEKWQDHVEQHHHARSA